LGLDALARESWNSGVGGDGDDGDDEVGGFGGGCGMGEMTSSRHWGEVDAADLRRGAGPVGVGMGRGLSDGEGATDWKAWMGRASRNSWAKMNGVLSVSKDRMSSGKKIGG